MEGSLPTRLENGYKILTLENEHLKVDVVPGIGGRILQIHHNKTGQDILWRNDRVRLELHPPGSSYDPNFLGGVDECIPSDIEEKVDGLAYPDHGELWTTPLLPRYSDGRLELSGLLPVSGLKYQKTLSLWVHEPALQIDYHVENITSASKDFQWKMHPAFCICPGDILDVPAARAEYPYPEWSRLGYEGTFDWPVMNGHDISLIPEQNGTADLLFLSGLSLGRASLESPGRGIRTELQFDLAVFPYLHIFGTYGGFEGHYTLIIEPCMASGLEVLAAREKGEAGHLDPGEAIQTQLVYRIERLECY